MGDLGRLLVIAGLVLLFVGGLFLLLPRLGINLGRLPGDFRFETGQFTCLVPSPAASSCLSYSRSASILLGRFFDR
jgi:hypothetical protein